MSTVFVVNPGSTSTKLALFREREELFEEELQHSREELAACGNVSGQSPLRMQGIRDVLAAHGVDGSQVDAVAGRGGLLAPLEGGVYEVSDTMLDDLKHGRYGSHPCNLGAVLARDLAQEWSVPAYIVDPVVTDEMDARARVTGMPGLERRSVFHALNQRGAARRAMRLAGRVYEDCCLVVAHMGGGMSVGAHRKGRVVDVTNGLDGEGPFTPERTGTLPVLPMLERMHNGQSFESLRLTVLREGGLWAHLGTNDMREVERRMEQGDEHCTAIFKAMAYSIAKHVGGMVPSALDGVQDRLDAIVLTGGMARSKALVQELTRMLSCLAPVKVVPGSVEMAALAFGVCLALAGKEPVRSYAG